MQLHNYFKINLLVLLLLFTSQAHSEDVRHFDVTFKVDEIRQVDDQSVMVKLFGDEALVAKDQLPAFVAGKYLVRQKVDLLDRKEVYRFALNAAKANSAEFSAQAWTALFESSAKITDQDMQAILALQQQGVFPDIVKRIISQTNQLSRHSELIGWLLCAATESDFEWLRGRIVSFVYINEATYKNSCKQRYLNYWANSEQAKATTLLDKFQELFGEGDKWFIDLRKEHDEIKELTEIINVRKLDQMSKLSEFAQKHPELATYFPTLIVKQAHASAEQAVANKDPLSALALLSWLDQSWRTPTTHDLVLKALRILQPSESQQLLSGRTADFLSFVASKDYTVKAVYLAYLQLALLNKTESGQLDSLEQCFSAITRIRPDPDATNDTLRINMAVALGRSGDTLTAREQLARMSRPLSWIEWSQLLFAGVFFSRFALWSLLLVILAGLVLLIYRLQTKQLFKSSAGIIEKSSDTETSSRPLFMNNSTRQSVDPRWQEYEKLLHSFGLSTESTLADIKTAYRKAVKILHPDTNPNLSEAEQEKFRTITQDHARLLEVRGQLGL